MAETRVVNLRREPYDVYIGRPGKGLGGPFGNPFPLKPGEPRGTTVERYRVYFYDRLRVDPAFAQQVERLRGRVLGCFCKPAACHGDVIKEYLDGASRG